MAVLNFMQRKRAPAHAGSDLSATLAGFSIEVMPRTATKVADFAALLPAGTRVYVAHIEGTPITDMVATAARLRAEGMEPMPHFPARMIASRAELADWIARYEGEAGVREALMLAGGLRHPAGPFDNSMAMMETGLFDHFRRLHVAGHPEGNRDIDADGGEAVTMAALDWKQAFARARGIEMAIVTQFVFDLQPVIGWAGRLADRGIDLPVHLGIAGPAKLQTLIKYAIACGVGPSLGVLQRRARDVTRLVHPFEPTELVTALARHRAAHPDTAIERVHVFPLGGIAPAAEWLARHGAPVQTAVGG